MSTSSVSIERRAYARKTLNPLPYINLPADNGGIILDVSEDGLRFRATAPMQSSGPIPFWFTAHSNLIEGEAELVWLDEARKTGGLRFIQLPSAAREQIRSWPADPNLRPSIGDDFALHIHAPEALRSRKGWNGRAVLSSFGTMSRKTGVWCKSFESKLRTRLRTLQPMILNGVAELRAVGSQARIRKSVPWFWRVAYGLALGIVVLALSYAYRRQAGQSLIWLGAAISGSPQVQTSAPAVMEQVAKADDRSADKSPIEKLPAQAALPPLNGLNGRLAAGMNANSNVLPGPQNQAPNVQLSANGAAGTELLVQVAALTDESGARNLAAELRFDNFPASVRTLPVDSLYRVVLGPYTDKVPALSVRGKLKRAGYHAFIRREPAAEVSDLRQSPPTNF